MEKSEDSYESINSEIFLNRKNLNNPLLVSYNKKEIDPFLVNYNKRVCDPFFIKYKRMGTVGGPRRRKRRKKE